MTDAELTTYLNLSPEEAAVIIPKLTPERRALFDRMKQIEIEVDLFVAGLGPKPKGVLLDFERGMKRRRAWSAATPGQNLANKRIQRNNRSGIKGVSRVEDGWLVAIGLKGRRVYTGYFRTKAEARAAYAAKSREIFGEFARAA